jgi:hypothetical protein
LTPCQILDKICKKFSLYYGFYGPNNTLTVFDSNCTQIWPLITRKVSEHRGYQRITDKFLEITNSNDSTDSESKEKLHPLNDPSEQSLDKLIHTQQLALDCLNGLKNINLKDIGKVCL